MVDIPNLKCLKGRYGERSSRLDALAYCKHTKWTVIFCIFIMVPRNKMYNQRPASKRHISSPSFGVTKPRKLGLNHHLYLFIHKVMELSLHSLTVILLFFGTDISRYHTQHRMDDFCNLEVSKLADDVLRHWRNTMRFARGSCGATGQKEKTNHDMINDIMTWLVNNKALWTVHIKPETVHKITRVSWLVPRSQWSTWV